jgi:hypothetical protein
VKSRSVKGKDTETGSKHTEDELGKEGDLLEESNQTNSMLAASNLMYINLTEETRSFSSICMKRTASSRRWT